jgi:hypothetical protein
LYAVCVVFLARLNLMCIRILEVHVVFNFASVALLISISPHGAIIKVVQQDNLRLLYSRNGDLGFPYCVAIVVSQRSCSVAMFLFAVARGLQKYGRPCAGCLDTAKAVLPRPEVFLGK